MGALPRNASRSHCRKGAAVLTVVAALIEWEGKLLVCQRRRGDRFELLWEFRAERKNRETIEEVLIRELQEELGVTAKIGREIYRTSHKYAEMSEPIELVFFSATADPAQMQNRVFEQIEWRAPESLGELDFLPADRELIEKLANGTLPWGQSSPSKIRDLPRGCSWPYQAAPEGNPASQTNDGASVTYARISLVAAFP